MVLSVVRNEHSQGNVEIFWMQIITMAVFAYFHNAAISKYMHYFDIVKWRLTNSVFLKAYVMLIVCNRKEPIIN